MTHYDMQDSWVSWKRLRSGQELRDYGYWRILCCGEAVVLTPPALRSGIIAKGFFILSALHIWTFLRVYRWSEHIVLCFITVWATISVRDKAPLPCHLPARGLALLQIWTYSLSYINLYRNYNIYILIKYLRIMRSLKSILECGYSKETWSRDKQARGSSSGGFLGIYVYHYSGELRLLGRGAQFIVLGLLMERFVLFEAFGMEVWWRVGFAPDLCWETVHQLTAPLAVERFGF